MKDLKYQAGNAEYIKQELLKLDASKAWRLSISEWKPKRSQPANRVYQSWYPAISNQMALTVNEATRYVKFHFGLPILFANKDFGFIIRDGLESKGFFNVEYERQLVYMDKLPVTRLFTTEMHNKLRDDLQHFFGQQGLSLEYK